jgi:hypothetical protein
LQCFYKAFTLSTSRRVLDKCHPLILTVHNNPTRFSWGKTVKPFMRLDEVMVNLHTFQNRGILLLQSPHDFLPVADLPVNPLHLIVISKKTRLDSFPAFPEQEDLATRLTSMCTEGIDLALVHIENETASGFWPAISPSFPPSFSRGS